MPKLVTWMNNQRVGELTKLANGAHTFKYAPEWLASRYARPLSLSLPLQRGNITSDAVFNFFDNLFIKAGRVRALAVERFDRRWNTERTVLLRLPQEDMCQTFGLPSSVKYESDGGPGIARIMAFLMGSSEALRDRYDFMKFQVFQWLIGATDGHAKNFSVFIQAGGSYRLTPFYDIISAFPVLGGTGIHISDLKLAMGLNASKGKKTAIDKIYPRHFLATAKVLRFPEVQMHEILSDFARMIPAALNTVVSEIWGLVVVNEHDNHDRQRLDSSLVYTGAHNVYYVKSCLSDAKCFSGSRYSFRVQELKPLLFHNWPVHGEIAWLFPAPC